MATPQSRSLPGRPHDLTSYAGAIVVYVAVTFLVGTRMLLPGGLAALGFGLWLAHFGRRIVECLWVHRYAGRRVPIGDAIGEYVYYWGFGGWIAYSLRGQAQLDRLAVVGAALFFVGEAGNAWAHLKLRGLRRPNTTERGIPSGGLFNWVACANYTYEVLAWLGFVLAVRTLPACIYLLGVVGVLARWASKRASRYRREFDGRDGRPLFPKSRRALIPWLF